MRDDIIICFRDLMIMDSHAVEDDYLSCSIPFSETVTFVASELQRKVPIVDECSVLVYINRQGLTLTESIEGDIGDS